MRTSLALRWKALVRKIHPPLPMTPREAQMLLKALNVSFKDDISKHHPSRGVVNANAHVKSILTSPLLVDGSAGMTEANTTSPETSSGNQSGMMEIFQKHISCGTMTLKSATLCLKALRKQCQASAHPPTAMQHTKAGETTLQWLWSSGQLNSFHFLKDLRFVKELIPCLIAEGNASIPNSWTVVGYETLKKDLSMSSLNKLFGDINLTIVKSEIKFGSGLASAVTGFVSSLRQHQGDRSKRELHSIYGRTGRSLVQAIETAQASAELPAATYSALRRSAQAWSKSNSFSSAWLALHDPTSSSVTETVSYLEHLDFDAIKDAREQRWRPTVDLSLRAAGILLEQNRRSRAAAIMEILKTRFPSHIGHREPDSRPAAAKMEEFSIAEAMNIRLLQNLVAD